MGSAFTPGGGSRGVIPKVMDTIFSRIEATEGIDFTVRVGFVEIHTVSGLKMLTMTLHYTMPLHPPGYVDSLSSIRNSFPWH